MKIYLYSRISTDKQDLIQQRNRVNEYLKNRNMKVSKEIFDKDVSGYKVSYKKRGLMSLLNMMSKGDCLICSELSRLVRKMKDMSDLINEELKPRKLRLIIVSMGIDLDCSRMKAIDELILQNFAFAAQVEAEMTKDRTQSALDAIKKEIAETGQHISKSGRVITRLGRQDDKVAEDWDKVLDKSIETRRKKAESNENNIRFSKWLALYESKNGAIDRHTDIMPILTEVKALGYKTSSGLEFNKNSLQMMIYRTHQRNLKP